MRDDAISTVLSSVIHRGFEDDVFDDCSHPIIDAKSSLIPSIDREQNGVARE